MSMRYDAFLSRIIDDGIASLKEDSLVKDKPRSLRGAIRGFEVCRGKTPEQLWALLDQAERDSFAAREKPMDEYWEQRWYALQIEWVCNVISAALVSSGKKGIIAPTARGTMCAARILGTGGVS